MRSKRIKKTLRITTVMLGVVVASALLLNSCKKENPIAPNLMHENFTTKSSFNCDASCIEVGGPYYEKTDRKTITHGSNSETVDFIYYNTETDFVVKVKSTKSWRDLTIDGVDVWSAGPVAANTWGVYSFPLPIDWEACDVTKFVLKVMGNGQEVSCNVSYSLIGLCGGCDTEFIGQAINCGEQREAIYRFTSATDLDYIKIQGGLTNFYGQDAKVIVTGGNLTVNQSDSRDGSYRIIKIDGSVEMCEEVTIRILWNSTVIEGKITEKWTVSDYNNIEITPSVPALECY